MEGAFREAYEQSVMDYIGVREVAVTAREKRDAEHVLRMDSKGWLVSEISDPLDIPEEVVKAIIANQRGAGHS